ncbi:MAG TPA: hypothetical protein VFF33_11120 [Ignavibacteriaceae bacterium]|nr:hypothetical protein [Ignavibacteriaceae bacterium]
MSAIIRIDQIVNDKTSGSSELLNHLTKLLLVSINNPKKFNTILEEVEAKLLHFSNIANFIKKVKSIKDKQKLEEYLKYSLGNGKYEILFELAKPILLKYNNLATLSNSITLYHILTKLAIENSKLRVNLAESRPKLEGRILTLKLLEKSVNVNLYIDAFIPEMVRVSNAVVIGADSILKDGSVINKIGSMSLALAAKYYNKSFYVVSLKSKKVNKLSFYSPLENPHEVWKYKNDKLRVFNSYFEKVPANLITKIITD